ncbi:Tn3 family transposase [Nonomuraea angiospora]
MGEAGRLVMPPLPAEVKELREELSSMLPFVPIASLLIELGARTHFLDCFTHAGGRKSKPSVEQKRIAVLIAGAANLGLTRLSEACGVPCDTLAWTQEWYAREETLREANTILGNHHYQLELAKKFGGGTMSSSDGQRFPVRGKSLTARDMTIHGGRVLSTYTHVSDQWSTYGTTRCSANDPIRLSPRPNHAPAGRPRWCAEAMASSHATSAP